MRTLKQLIQETVEIYRLTEVTATYLVQPSEIILQAPETYNESDIQIYMDDLWLNGLPSDEKYATQYFGVNKDSIIDAHLEYATYEHTDLEPREYIKWESKYDIKNSNADIKLEYFRIKNLKYIITFDRFDLTGVNDNTVRDALYKIFRAAETTYEHKYSLDIKFDSNSLFYRK